MIGMNVKQENSKWHDTVIDEEIVNVCILREMIEIREGGDICDNSNIGCIDFLINELCAN